MKKLFTHPFLWLQIICFAVLYFSLPKFLLHPNEYIFNQWGDGIKNYFTPSWFVQYDSGTHFSGMAYPFGEHVVYTDNQPALSWMLNFVDEHIWPVSSYTVGIINLCMLLSLLFCAMLLYKILVHYRIPPWGAVVAAVLITFMNPQMQRIGGHYALSYACYIPLLWWLSIVLKKKNYSLLYSAFIAAVITFFSFLHLYYAFIGLLFFSTYLLIVLLKKVSDKKTLLSHSIILIVPFVSIFSFMHFTDKTNDRTPAPYGFFSYEASLQSVFLPREGKLATAVYCEPIQQRQEDKKKTFCLKKGDSEGYAYVGIIASITALISLFVFISGAVKKKTIHIKVIHTPGDLSVYVLAAILSLLFSFAFPFSLGLQSAVDDIPFLNQFRSLGRFAWIFYFVFTVYTVAFLHNVFSKAVVNKKYAAFFFITLVCILAAVETNTTYIRNCKAFEKNSQHNPFLSGANFWRDRLSENGYTPDDFQATLFVGFFLNGSEKLYIDRSGYDSGKAMEIAYQTGLPLINAMLSRTSVSETLLLAQAVSHSSIKKTYPQFLNDKNILLITNEKELIPQEKYLIAKSKFICQVAHLKLYAMPVSVYDDTQQYLKNQFKEVQQVYYFDSTYHYYSQKPIQLFYQNNFDDHTSPEPFEGTGSYFEETGGKHLAEIPIETADTIWIEISFWAKTYSETTAYPNIKAEFLNDNGQIIKTVGVNPKNSADVIDTWVRALENVEVTPECKKITLRVSNDKMVNFDNLLVRHTAYDVFYDISDSSSFTFNNYPVGK